MADRKKTRKILFRLLEIVFSVAPLLMLTVSLILARPQEDKAMSPSAQPAAEASQAISIDNEADLIQLVSAFPAPVMAFGSGSEMTFVSAVAADAAVSGGFGRIATLYWQTSDGEQVILKSIWPAGALDLLEGNYHFMPYAGPTFFGSTSVRMENDHSIRIHTTTDQALYTITLPQQLKDQVTFLCQALQLFTANQQD